MTVVVTFSLSSSVLRHNLPMLCVGKQQKMEKNGVIETRTERRTVITRDGDNVDHDKVIRFVTFSPVDVYRRHFSS